MHWQNLTTAFIVEEPLLPSGDTAHCAPIRFVKKGNCLCMLPFSILYHKPQSWVIGINRQLCATPFLARVATQKVEAVLSDR
jgi:hypothetical protein